MRPLWPSLVRTVLGGVLLLVLVSLALAPVLTMGWCADAPPGGTSVCGSRQTSVLGIESSLWLWIGAVILVVLAVAGRVVSRIRRRHD